MVIIGVINGIVVICVSITPDQEENLRDMYPECILMQQQGGENIGWTYDGSVFSPPLE